MAPQVLHRVCHGSMAPDNPIYTASNLTTAPAILHGFRRHRVKGADYPAILPVQPSHSGISDTSSSVRGTYVTGLTANDVWRLDIFEGDEYERRVVNVRLLEVVGDDDGTGKGNVEGEEEVQAETYVWIAGPEALEEREWDFGEFQREKMRFWVGGGGDGDVGEREDIVGEFAFPIFPFTFRLGSLLTA